MPLLEFGKKIVVLGDEGIPKERLLQPFVEKAFDTQLQTKLGVTQATLRHRAQIQWGENDISVNLHISAWALTGNRSRKSTHRLYLRGADGAVIFCEGSLGKSVEGAGYWMSLVREELGIVPVAIVVVAPSQEAADATDLESLSGQPGLVAHKFGASLEDPAPAGEALRWVATEVARVEVQREESESSSSGSARIFYSYLAMLGAVSITLISFMWPVLELSPDVTAPPRDYNLVAAGAAILAASLWAMALRLVRGRDPQNRRDVMQVGLLCVAFWTAGLVLAQVT